MNIPLTEYHDLIIIDFQLNCQSGSWSVSYRIEDKFTKGTRSDVLTFDRYGDEFTRTPKDIADRLVDFLKDKINAKNKQ